MKNDKEHQETSRLRRRLSRTGGLTIILAVAAFTNAPAIAQHSPSTVDQLPLDRIVTFAAQPLAPVHLTVPPGVETAIPIKTLPNGVCTLHPEDSDDPAQSLTLYADQEGIIRFYVRPTSRSDVHARLEARCRADDQVALVPIESGLNPRHFYHRSGTGESGFPLHAISGARPIMDSFAFSLRMDRVKAPITERLSVAIGNRVSSALRPSESLQRSASGVDNGRLFS